MACRQCDARRDGAWRPLDGKKRRRLGLDVPRRPCPPLPLRLPQRRRSWWPACGLQAVDGRSTTRRRVAEAEAEVEAEEAVAAEAVKSGGGVGGGGGDGGGGQSRLGSSGQRASGWRRGDRRGEATGGRWRVWWWRGRRAMRHERRDGRGHRGGWRPSDEHANGPAIGGSGCVCVFRVELERFTVHGSGSFLISVEPGWVSGTAGYPVQL